MARADTAISCSLPLAKIPCIRLFPVDSTARAGGESRVRINIHAACKGLPLVSMHRKDY